MADIGPPSHRADIHSTGIIVRTTVLGHHWEEVCSREGLRKGDAGHLQEDAIGWQV